MSGSWAARMRAAAVAAASHPEWWAMALAAFLLRGGIVLIVLPLVSLPTSASLTTMLAPPLEALILGRPSLVGVLVGAVGAAIVLGALAAAGVIGAWLDAALVREAAEADELDLTWRPLHVSPVRALGIRLAAHAPTAVLVAYAVVRLSLATRDELLQPGDPGLALAARVVLRAPEALIVVGLAWLVGETVGPLAVRRVAAGDRPREAMRHSLGQALGRRGLATLVVTTAAVLALAAPFVVAIGRAWENVRGSLGQGLDAVQVSAALLLLVSSWVLGLALLGAVLAWRSTAWTALVGVPRVTTEGAPAPLVEGSTG